MRRISPSFRHSERGVAETYPAPSSSIASICEPEAAALNRAKLPVFRIAVVVSTVAACVTLAIMDPTEIRRTPVSASSSTVRLATAPAASALTGLSTESTTRWRLDRSGTNGT